MCKHSAKQEEILVEMFKQAFFSFTYPSISRNVRTHAPYKEVKKGSVRQNKINSTFFYHQEKTLRFSEPKEPSSYEEAVKRFQKMKRLWFVS